MKKKIFCLSILMASFTTAFSQVKQKSTAKKAVFKYTNYVDPLIGTGFHGHVFVGANVPFGAVQLGPTNISEGWDWSSGYHISDSTIVGFQHTHLSGTGIGDLGDISFMPTTGKLIVNRGRPGDLQDKNYYSLFDRKDELVKPGFYKVKLQRYNVGVRLTATNRVGFHEYTFPQSSKSHIIIDLAAGIGWDKATKTYIKKVNNNTIEGYRYSTGWAKDQRIYFTAVFSKQIKDFSVYDSLALVNGIEATGRNLKGIISFASVKNEKIAVKVGISPVSCANALLNIKTEIPDWNFENVVAKADAAWNKELSKIAIKADSTAQLRKFYTALYHTMIAPSTFNDANGDYRGVDKKVYKKASFQNLTTFSLWDTYRAIHPLYTIVQPTRVNDMINSM
ncbi:MAG: glycoside hydrolase family 92 protein, partial [Pedobacter sp.]